MVVLAAVLQTSAAPHGGDPLAQESSRGSVPFEPHGEGGAFHRDLLAGGKNKCSVVFLSGLAGNSKLWIYILRPTYMTVASSFINNFKSGQKS